MTAPSTPSASSASWPTSLVHDTPAKVFFIVDRLPAHRAAKVQQWMQDNKDRMELFYLPPYSSGFICGEYGGR